MPLTFLVPALLAGLGALVVPVLIHLRRREREKPMRFPSLMFLARVPITTARRRRVTDWPLLLLRLLILALAVAAFARPVIRPRPGAVVHGARRVVLLMDRSLSMGHSAVWPAAVDSADAIIKNLKPDDKIAVIAFDEDAAVLQPMTLDHAAALAAVHRIHPGARGTRFGAGLRAARELFTRDAGLASGEVLMVTDLQRTGAASVAGLKLPPNITVRAVNASPAIHGNSAVVGVDVQRLPGGEDNRGRLAVGARLASTNLIAPRIAHVNLTINGRPAGTRDVTLPVNGTASVAFDPQALPVGEVRLVVAANPDSLPADDTFRAVVPAQVTRRIILGVPPDIAPDETFYLEHALETGRDPAFRIEQRSVGALDAATLRDAAIVLLYDVAPPAGAAGTALAAWVHDGGGLVVAAGPRLGARSMVAGYLPGTVQGMVDRRDDRGGVLGVVSLEHPVFAPFRGAAAATLGVARFFHYAHVVPSADAQVIAAFDDASPALVERQEGAGHVLLTAIPLDTTAGNFPLQPSYLPFLRSLALYTAGQGVAPLWRITGDGWPVPAAIHDPVVRSPSDSVLRIDRQRTGGALPLVEAGFYGVFDGRASGDPVTTVAVNPPAGESDLGQMAASELLVGVGQDTVTSAVQSAATLAEAESRQRIWRMLLLLAAIALVVETVMASRGWRGVAAKTVGETTEGSTS
jgi:hypothetical protein